VNPKPSRPRFFYGWVVVSTSALGLFFGAFPIVVSSFAVFFKPYIQEFHATRAAISLAILIHNIGAGSLATWIGRLTDRFGARKVIVPGLGILGVILISAEVIGSKLWQLILLCVIGRREQHHYRGSLWRGGFSLV
jgi:MFS family permease